MQYRPDIDGLRAIAVLSVVLFHSGLGLLSGGFVGVDIFFVISGFLITSIIIDDLNKNKFSIKHFYERRIRRIFPALYVVCVVSLVFSYFIFLPDELEAFGKSLVATLLFFSNILFWSETGYFDASADLKPLLHTWSLAVEEQFYIFFPILLIVVSKFFKSRYAPLLIIVGALSFILSVWGAEHKPSATFYWAPTRAWELIIGAILALRVIPSIKRRWQSELLGVIGFLLIAYAVFFFDYDTEFPGLNALFPCLGSALLIYSQSTQKSLTYFVLSRKPLVFIGLCSYSFYLWHWPVFVFAKYLSIEPLTQIESLFLILFSFILSVITWKFIEAPFRNKNLFSGKWKIFILALLTSIPLFIASVSLISSKGAPYRFPDIEKLETYKGSIIDTKCVDINIADFDQRKCIFGDEIQAKTSFVVWGDSHAGAFVRGIGEGAENYNKSGYLASTSGCPPILNVITARDREPYKCQKSNNSILKKIQKTDLVFLVARWTYYTRKSLINHDGPVWLNNQNSTLISELENYRVLEQGLNVTVKAIKEKGAMPIIVSTVPEFTKSVPEAYFLFDKQVKISKNLFDQNRQKTDQILRNISQQNSVLYIDPSSVFCDEKKCVGNNGDQVYFSDNDHLNLNGAQKLFPMFQSVFR